MGTRESELFLAQSSIWFRGEWALCRAQAFHDRTEYHICIDEEKRGQRVESKSVPFSIWRDGTRDEFTAASHGRRFFDVIGADYSQLKFLDPAEDRSDCQYLLSKHIYDPNFSWTRWGYTIKSLRECELPRDKEYISLKRAEMPGQVLEIVVDIVTPEEPQRLACIEEVDEPEPKLLIVVEEVD
jgi:hypothetical protein